MREPGFEPGNLYGPDLKSGAFDHTSLLSQLGFGIYYIPGGAAGQEDGISVSGYA